MGTPEYNPISTIQELVNFVNAKLGHPGGKVQRRYLRRSQRLLQRRL